MKLDARSIYRLEGVHPDLVKVVERAAELTDTLFIITEGLRSLERQKKLVSAGASTTLRSRHLTGHAVDVAAFVDMDGSGEFTSGDNIRWDWPLYGKIASFMKTAAFQVNVPIEWGGDWTTFKDGPHFQLPWAEYPLNNG
jgi:peptidoglycan L-alanyl-D-glutamate endopeptidase CwlK